MEKVEQYIKEHTNRYSNHVELAANITSFTQWLTVDDARMIAEIAKKETAESFAEIIRGNLSVIDKSVQEKFEQLYTEITGEKMYKGFKD